MFNLDFTIAKSLKGSSGAIKDIRPIEGSFVVLTCGFDRFIRVFNYKTYEELPQVYLKNKLNVIFPLEYESVQEKEQEEAEESDEMYDDDELEEDEELNDEPEDDFGNDSS